MSQKWGAHERTLEAGVGGRGRGKGKEEEGQETPNDALFRSEYQSKQNAAFQLSKRCYQTRLTVNGLFVLLELSS